MKKTIDPYKFNIKTEKMQRYINQLIEDLHEINRELNPSGNNKEETVHDEETFLKHIEDVESYIHGKQIPISEITGVLPEQLPPPEKLNKKQLAQLSVELENFLAPFHFTLDFPANYPRHLRYRFIKNFWEEEHSPMQLGTSHIEFCYYDKTDCPFPGYCTTCDEFDIDMDDKNPGMDKFDESDNDRNGLPF